MNTEFTPIHKQIESELKTAWGPGLSRLPEDLQRALYYEKMIRAILCQASPEFRPAQDYIRGILRERY